MDRIILNRSQCNATKRRNIFWALALTFLTAAITLATGEATTPASAAAPPVGLRGSAPALTGTPTYTPTPYQWPSPVSCSSMSGSISESDPVQIGGFVPAELPGNCNGWGGPCPGLVDQLPHHYDVSPTFGVYSSSYLCITIVLDAPSCTGEHAIYSVPYDTFNPNSICTSYMGRMAVSPHGSYSFEIPCCARGRFTVVVAEVNPGAVCSAYTLSILGAPWCPTVATPTWTPTLTRTPALSNTPTPTSTTGPTGTGTPTDTTVPTITTTPGITATHSPTPCVMTFTDVSPGDYFYNG